MEENYYFEGSETYFADCADGAEEDAIWISQR